MKSISSFAVESITAATGTPFAGMGTLKAVWPPARGAWGALRDAWQGWVMRRAAKPHGFSGSGVPVANNKLAVIEQRVHITAFNAQQVSTRDTVPVNVDAFMFWYVHDAQKATLAITEYRQVIEGVAQTSLRAMIGSTMLASMLCNRLAADWQLCEQIGGKTGEWGVTVRSGEIRDVTIAAARQARDDARSLLALRLCLARHRARAVSATRRGFVDEASRR